MEYLNNQHNDSPSLAVRIALAAVLTAVTAVFTLMVRIPVAPTRGYINLGDVAIYFTAFTFGPITAMIAGGLGTAIADLTAGYPQWAPISLVINALRGFAVGFIIRRAGKPRDTGKEPPEQTMKRKAMILGGIAGTVIMTGLYFLAGGAMVGFPAAAVEIPGNILQNAVGILAGTLLSASVIRAYPPVNRLSW